MLFSLKKEGNSDLMGDLDSIEIQFLICHLLPIPPKSLGYNFPLRLIKIKKADLITYYVKVDVEKWVFSYIVGGAVYSYSPCGGQLGNGYEN